MVDGAFFGPSFPNMVMLNFPQIFNNVTKPAEKYEAKVFGFKMHKTAISKPPQVEFCPDTSEFIIIPKAVPEMKGGIMTQPRVFIKNI